MYISNSSQLTDDQMHFYFYPAVHTSQFVHNYVSRFVDTFLL
jgi:hypothetical protein